LADPIEEVIQDWGSKPLPVVKIPVTSAKNKQPQKEVTQDGASPYPLLK
jgi:hypothetical protein